MTATTTGVDVVYRQMLRWQAQWQLDVDFYHVTSAWAAVNVAGNVIGGRLLHRRSLDGRRGRLHHRLRHHRLRNSSLR